MKLYKLLILLLLTGCSIQYKPIVLESLDKFILLEDGWLVAARDTEDRIEIHTKQEILQEAMVSEVFFPEKYEAEYRKIQTDRWLLRIENKDDEPWCVNVGWQGIDYVRTTTGEYVYVPANTKVNTWYIEQQIWQLEETYIVIEDAHWKITGLDLQKPQDKMCV